MNKKKTFIYFDQIKKKIQDDKINDLIDVFMDNGICKIEKKPKYISNLKKDKNKCLSSSTFPYLFE